MTFAWYAHLQNLADRAALCIVGAVYFVFRAPATP